MNPTRIFLVRHGQVHNPENILYGRLPGFRLSETGRVEAERVARLLRPHPLAAVFSSPLDRALETARAIARLHPAGAIQPSDYITEVYTPFEGRPTREADALAGDVYTGSSAPFEQPEDVLDRTLGFFRQVRQRYFEREVAAVTHGDVIVFAALWACGLSASAAHKVNFSRLGVLPGYPATGSITTFTFLAAAAGERPRVQPGVPAWCGAAEISTDLEVLDFGQIKPPPRGYPAAG